MKRDAVDIIPYQPQWLAQFKTAKKDLENALGNFAQDKEHIGSTSIAKITRFDRDAYFEIKDPACDLIMVNAKIWAGSKQRNKT